MAECRLLQFAEVSPFCVVYCCLAYCPEKPRLGRVEPPHILRCCLARERTESVAELWPPNQSFFSKPTAAWQFAQENIASLGWANHSVKLGRQLAGICWGVTLFAQLAAALQATRGKNISGVGTIICEKLTVRLLWDLGLFALATAWQIARNKKLGAKIISWNCGEW